jgi:hypothetical protein
MSHQFPKMFGLKSNVARVRWVLYKEIDEMASKLCAPGFEVAVHQLVR